MKLDSLASDAERIRATLICLLKTQADQKAISIEVVDRLAGQAA